MTTFCCLQPPGQGQCISSHPINSRLDYTEGVWWHGQVRNDFWCSDDLCDVPLLSLQSCSSEAWLSWERPEYCFKLVAPADSFFGVVAAALISTVLNCETACSSGFSCVVISGRFTLFTAGQSSLVYSFPSRRSV